MINSKLNSHLERVKFACQITRDGFGFGAGFALSKQLLLQTAIVSIAWELSTTRCLTLAAIIVMVHALCCLLMIAAARDALLQRCLWTMYKWKSFNSSTMATVCVGSFCACAVILAVAGWAVGSSPAATYVTLACSSLCGAAIDAIAIAEIVRKYDIVHKIPNPLIDRTPLEHIPTEFS